MRNKMSGQTADSQVTVKYQIRKWETKMRKKGEQSCWTSVDETI